jgi:hypothetical protein
MAQYLGAIRRASDYKKKQAMAKNTSKVVGNKKPYRSKGNK